MFHVGVVENRHDPLKLGRCQVRVVGLHTDDRTVLPTKDLPWATPIQPITSAGVSGIGYAPVGPVEGSWVCIVYRDKDQQQPMMLGTIGGIPLSNPDTDPNKLEETIGKEDLSGTSDTNLSAKPPAPLSTQSVLGPVAKIIAKVAPESYDAKQNGGTNTNVTNMTIAEVMEKQATRQLANVGKYAITPADLRNAIKTLNIDPSLKLNDNIQDMILQEYLSCRKQHAVVKYYRGAGNVQDAARALAVDYPLIEDPLYENYSYGGEQGKYNREGFKPNVKSSELQSALQQEYQSRNSGAVSKSPLNTQGVSASEVKADILSPTTSPSSSKPQAISGGGSFGGFFKSVLSSVVSQVTSSLGVNLGSLTSGLSNLAGGLNLSGGLANLTGGNQLASSLLAKYAPTNLSPAASIVSKLNTLSTSSFTEVLPIGQKNDTGTTSMGISTTKSGTLTPAQAGSAQRPGAIGKGNGFMDSTGVYPLYTDEPDTNRLAVNHNITKTSVIARESSRVTGISIANGGTWDQANVSYNAVYPFNHVYQSESGHLMEFDDTKGSERVHIYHTKGSFVEYDPNGSRISRIVGDGYEIIDNNGYVYVKGALNVTVDGAMNLKTDNVLNIEVSGEAQINVFNNANINVSGDTYFATRGKFTLKANEVNIESSGDLNLRADKNLNIHSTQNMSLLSESSTYMWSKNAMNIGASAGNLSLYAKGDINVKSDANLNLQSKGRWSGRAGGLLALDGKRIAIQSGASSEAGKAVASPVTSPVVNLELPQSSRATGGEAAKHQLMVPARGAEVGFDSPEDGDPSKYAQKSVQEGKVSKQEVEQPKIEIEKAPPAKPSGAPPAASCDTIFNMDPSQFTAAMKLSKYFTLGDVTAGGARIPRVTYTLTDKSGKTSQITPQEIVCNLKGLCENVLDPIAEKYGRDSFVITSAFRRPPHEGKPGDLGTQKEGGDHPRGSAADIAFKAGKAKTFEICKELPKLLKSWNQIIMEYNGTQCWIHVAFKYKGNNGHCFTMNHHQTYAGTFPNGGFVLV